MKIFTIWLFAFFLGTMCCYSQDNATMAFPQTVPPSPDAAALGRYGETPVSHYTGIPEIKVPLYEIKSRKLKLPIQLSYHAGGNKVEDLASSVGLGWTLEGAWGTITRSLQGLPDESTQGFLNNYLSADMTGFSTNDMKLIAENRLDGQADEFYFNFGGYSGKLIFGKDGTCYSIPHFDFGIKPAMGPLSDGSNQWVITTPAGVTYTFAQRENLTVKSACSSGFADITQNGGYTQLTYTSSWFLSKIQAPQPAEAITFSYKLTSFQQSAKGSIGSYVTSGGGTSGTPKENSCSTSISVASAVVQNITFPGGKIVFEIASRSDLSGGLRVTAMTVMADDGSTIKKFLFSNDSYYDAGCGTAICKRLKLDAVTEIGANGTQMDPHLFYYNTVVLPSRNSNDTDHWGYFNNKGNTLSIGEFIDYFSERPDLDYLPGANRKPNPDAAKAGILTKIAYPTGGSTSFDYELNEVISSSLPNKTSAQQKVRIDGTTPPVKESSVFTINGYYQGGLYVRVRYQTAGCSSSKIPSIEDNCPYTQIVGAGFTTYSSVFQSATIKETVFFLPNGQYKLRGAKAATDQSYFIEIIFEPEVNSANKFAGGLRIKSITDSDGLNGNKNIIRKFDYNDASGNSTGRLMSLPIYTYEYKFYSGCTLVTAFGRTEQSQATLGNTRGSAVGYGRVVELLGASGENGKTEFYYTSAWKSEVENTTEFLDNYVYTLPFGPAQQDNDWKRGFLVKKIAYKYNVGAYIPIEEEETKYGLIGTPIQILGTKMAVYKAAGGTCGGGPAEYRSTLIRRYGMFSYLPLYSTNKKFGVNSEIIGETRTDYTFSDLHRNLISQVVTLNQNTASPWKTTTLFKYPGDYKITNAQDEMALSLSAMQSEKHIHNVIIEKQLWESRNGIDQLVDADLNLFKYGGLELDKTLKLATDSPLPGFGGATVNVTGTFTYDKEKFKVTSTTDLYDHDTGNILEFTAQNGVKLSYLWDSQKLYPVAAATGVGQDKIFYTSFETVAEKGNWSWDASISPITGNAVTGTHFFSGAVETASVLPAGTYRIAFWYKGNGNININGSQITVNNANWSPYVYLLSIQAASKIQINSGSVNIDELRASPASAQMLSYTYLPLRGTISESDYSNVPTRYSYDEFGRLQFVSDYKGNLVRHYAYNTIGFNGTPGNPPPATNLYAVFIITGDKTTGQKLTFEALNSAPGLEYTWDFGDGTIKTTTTPTIDYTYTAAGGYAVQLTVSKGGDSNFSINNIIVNLPLIVDTSWPAPTVTGWSYSGLLDPIVYLNVTIQPAAGGLQPIKEYMWELVNLNGETVFKTRTTEPKLKQPLTATVRFRAVGADGVASQEGVLTVLTKD